MRFLLLMVTVFLFGCGEKKDEYTETVIETGYKGPARVNPYLAAERFLKKGGWDAKSSRLWGDYGNETATIIMPGSFLSTKGIGMRVMEWVDEGGMLVITLSGGEAEINDFNRNSWRDLSAEEEFRGLDYLLEELEITLEEGSFDEVGGGEDETGGHLKTSWSVAEVGVVDGEDDHDLKLEFEGDLAMSAPRGEEWDVPGTSRMVTVPHGDGQVMVLSHARLFRNPYLGRADHATFLELVADWHYDGEIIFLYGSGTSLKDLLWQHAWQVVVAGLVLLLAWLWMRIPRFGPLREDEHTYRVPYGEGLKASAKFLWRKKALGHLIRPLRSELERENSGEAGALYEKMAAEAELPTDEVIEAFTSENFQDPGTVTRMVQKLQLLRKR
ncbi:MAG: DUF4350 domain-containing protein [Akkermansiaceae bacterium]